MDRGGAAGERSADSPGRGEWDHVRPGSSPLWRGRCPRCAPPRARCNRTGRTSPHLNIQKIKFFKKRKFMCVLFAITDDKQSLKSFVCSVVERHRTDAIRIRLSSLMPFQIPTFYTCWKI